MSGYLRDEFLLTLFLDFWFFFKPPLVDWAAKGFKFTSMDGLITGFSLQDIEETLWRSVDDTDESSHRLCE